MGGKHDIGHYPHKNWILENTYLCLVGNEGMIHNNYQ